MSYILDALKKADRERSLAKVPTLTTVQLPVHVAGRRAALWVAALLCVSGGAAAWFLWPPSSSVPVAPAGSSAGIDAPAPMESLTLERPPAPPAQPTVARPGSVKRAPAVAPVAPPQESVQRPEPDVVATPRPPRTELPPLKATPVSPEPAPSAPALAAPPPAPPRLESLPRPERGQGPSAPVPAAPPPAQLTLREAAAKLTLEVFVYTDVEADRMVVVSGRRYVKGQLVDGLYLLEEITPEGAVLSFRGERIVLRP